MDAPVYALFLTFLNWVESSALAIWVGQSLWGFPISLTLHALGMGFLAGGNLAMALRLWGFAPSIPLPALLRVYPFLWGCAGLSLISGVMLLSAYPAKALTNGVFYFKILLVTSGLWVMALPLRRLLQQEPAVASSRALALLIALLWLGTIAAGRFLAYTHNVLSVSELLAD
jgi:hypothetical protein